MIECVNSIKQGKYNDIHSLLIVKDGKLVFEEYFGAEGKIWSPFVNRIFRDRIQALASVTKSINSALIGIAKYNGFIKDLNDPAFELFPEYSSLMNNKKKQLNVKHLLTMSAGLKWNELDIPYSNHQNDSKIMQDSNDLIKYCLEKPVVLKPGEKFVYHTGLSIILGEILKRSVGIPVDKYAEKNLFTHLGISKYKWSKLKNDVIATGGGLALCSRDMAKFGQLYLNNGKWNNKQVVPEEWVKESTQSHIKTTSGSYGYQWWLRSYNVNSENIDSFYAIGNSGQFILVFPELMMVIISTAQNFDSGWSQNFFNLVSQYILAAMTK
jgi:CubicO group peptidase (beta-lactamase class C family)